ncbi:Uncharacterized conserved protein, DUF58 family, contains vWF domain [Saccharopolyspora kobensis]|uniref:Uncharacterized conserved protein, DUF58 family, contains vWF domain n=1 Tax=Saccharopolyspora kobensis TaxID=146035 RepID=A0A1H6BYP0_9PSEU|nr:DUF58 domain-containing protein [Saccharopolyspora kobensis]SEG65773.1 Uncharacterized conserved protein, DUF58 family, contains vWF domain [Saccharopolyspora kobensis]SFC20985.1 Uncharacterized conserved protein, DUF58 family, contains vWF domain [Saccharopolyspora kobensis]
MLSGLTIRGRCLLAAGVAAGVCALVLDERDLLRVSAFVIALPLLALLLTSRTRFGIAARREVVPVRIPVGGRATVRLHLSASGRLPIGGLALEDNTPHALGGRHRFRLDAVPRHGGTILEYPVSPALRGIHHIGPLRTRIDDPFGLAEFERELADRSRLIAVPHVVRLTGLPAGSGLGTGEDGATRLRAGHGEDDAVVRQYRHGDDIRRVHWKSTARRDELMVRVEERPWHAGVTVLLDRRSAAHRGTGARSSLEWAVSAVASFCLHLHQHGQQVQLITEDCAQLATGAETSGEGHDDAVLDALAAVRASPQRDLVFSRDPGAGQELIAVLGETTTAAVDELTKLRPQGTRSLAVLLDVRSWNGEGGGYDPQLAARRLRAAGWTAVVTPGPATAINTVWQQLCRETTAPESEVLP